MGNGIQLSSKHDGLQAFIQAFWSENRLEQRLDEWSDELVRSGELFPVLYPNPAGGMVQVRIRPASVIERIVWQPGDYEVEVRYQEAVPLGAPEKWWSSPLDPQRPALSPVMLHYAVNRPVGALRGESDLAAILPWLRRYSRWLEDRVRLNAAVRTFLWIVKASRPLKEQLAAQYRRPPEAGSVIVADRDHEEWEAVAPNLRAADASHDGRAIRWMIAAGGPGTSLLDFGEGEDANLATGKAMAEQRRRFLRRRQAYLAWLLTDLVLNAYRLQQGAEGETVRHQDIVVDLPDISPEDNEQLAGAVRDLVGALEGMQGMVGDSAAYRSMALRLFGKFLGEQLSEQEFRAILEAGEGA